MLDRLIRRGLVVVDQGSGRVVGSWGLSSAPTEHRLRIRGRELYTWCAVDAVGVPAGLGEDATVTSHCSHCGAPVSITMIAGQVGRAEPAGVHVWVAPVEQARSVVGDT